MCKSRLPFADRADRADGGKSCGLFQIWKSSQLFFHDSRPGTWYSVPAETKSANSNHCIRIWTRKSKMALCKDAYSSSSYGRNFYCVLFRGSNPSITIWKGTYSKPD